MVLQKLLKADSLKYNRSVVMLLVLLLPLAICTIQFINFSRFSISQFDMFNPWVRFFQAIYITWTMLMLPFFFVLITTLSNYLEHKNNMWKYFFSLPISKNKIVFAKYLTMIKLFSLSQIFLFVFYLASSFLFKYAFGIESFEVGNLPIFSIIGKVIITLITSFFALSIHWFVSLYWKNVMVNILMGVIMFFVGLIASSIPVAVYLVPWSLPVVIHLGEYGVLYESIPQLVLPMVISLVGSAIVLFWGTQKIIARNY